MLRGTMLKIQPFVWSMFFTLNRGTLQLNMLLWLGHVFHAEPLRTSAKHALDRSCSNHPRSTLTTSSDARVAEALLMRGIGIEDVA